MEWLTNLVKRQGPAAATSATYARGHHERVQLCRGAELQQKTVGSKSIPVLRRSPFNLQNVDSIRDLAKSEAAVTVRHGTVFGVAARTLQRELGIADWCVNLVPDFPNERAALAQLGDLQPSGDLARANRRVAPLKLKCFARLFRSVRADVEACIRSRNPKQFRAEPIIAGESFEMYTLPSAPLLNSFLVPLPVISTVTPESGLS